MRKRAPQRLRAAERGLVHAYIGDGKGKTTAAVGTAVRAAGYGWPVCFLQFMKESKWPSGERASLKRLGIEVEVLGAGFYKILNDTKTVSQHRRAAARALNRARQGIFSGKFKLVILDELGSAVESGLLGRRAVEEMLRSRATDPQARMAHLIWTGHERIPWMLKYADLVSEMRMVKHPYYRGILATKGIDF